MTFVSASKTFILILHKLCSAGENIGNKSQTWDAISWHLSKNNKDETSYNKLKWLTVIRFL